MSWRTPLSVISKSSLFSAPTRSPARFRTVAMMCTRLTLVRKTVSCATKERDPRASRIAALTRDWDILIPLSFHPDFPVGKMLLLPDRHQLFQAVDAFERGVERRPAVRRGHDDGHTGFPD